ncbi:MAG: hypothetical protein H5T46_04345, partial [Archaeoglobi archaeon]|nr:hypothetical protein [Candidatus Mnemosynella sp.]
MMKVISIILLISLLLSALTGCAEIGEESSAQIFEKITAEEAKRLVEEKKGDPNFIIIDLRTPKEYS